MRKLFVAVAACLLCGTSAHAGTTYDFVFRAGGGGTANGNQYTFASLAAAQSGQPVSDIFLRTTDELVLASTSIGFDTSLGMSAARADEWSGLLISAMRLVFFLPDPPGADVDNVGGIVRDFGGFLADPVPPPSPPGLRPGTYNIGTIVWDLSGASEGISGIFNFRFFAPCCPTNTDDQTFAFLPPGSGNIVDLTGTEVLGSGFINIVPEPSTAALLGLGLTSLVLFGRRRSAT